MYKCLIWGVNDEYTMAYDKLLFEISKGNLSIEALISKDKYAKYIDGKEVIDKAEISNYQFDYIIIFNKERFSDIKNEALELGIPESKILNGKFFFTSNFDFKRYCKLIENPITIISDDCWGGLVSSYLGLKFNSPFINFYIHNDDYIKFLENMDYYLEQELKVEQEGNVYSCTMPKGSLGTGSNKIILNFNHQASFSEAKNDWDERKARINKKNLFIKMLIKDDNEKLVKRFNNLPYKNKVCFHPKPMKYKSIAFFPRYIWRCINYAARTSNSNLEQYTMDMSWLEKSCDILKMLCGEEDFIREK
ncbi:hypothetical protein NL50_02150 [Clostridium acetobutylicum]|nr:hypothetical protein NL50_02150 [Clostridium acetobutylicum]